MSRSPLITMNRSPVLPPMPGGGGASPYAARVKLDEQPMVAAGRPAGGDLKKGLLGKDPERGRVYSS